MIVLARVFGTLVTLLAFGLALRWLWTSFLRGWLFKEEVTAKVVEAGLEKAARDIDAATRESGPETENRNPRERKLLPESAGGASADKENGNGSN